MPISFSTVTHSLRKQSQIAGTDIKLSHCQQLLAAAFGYKSLAAMQAAQADFAESPDFDEVDSVCLNQEMLALRAGELGVALDSTELVSAIAAALRTNLPKAYVYVGEDAWSEGVREYITALVEGHSDVTGLIADTNNNGISETHVPFDLSDEVVPPPEQTLSTNMQVRITLEVDLERPYAGHQIDVTVDLRIDRLGRALWGEPRGHVTFWKLADESI